MYKQSIEDERNADLYLGAAAGMLPGAGVGYFAGKNKGEGNAYRAMRNMLGSPHPDDLISDKQVAKAFKRLQGKKNIDEYIKSFKDSGKTKGIFVGALVGAGLGAGAVQLAKPAPQVHNVWVDPNHYKDAEYQIDKVQVILRKLADIQARPGAQQHLLPLGQMKRDKILKSMSFNRNT